MYDDTPTSDPRDRISAQARYAPGYAPQPFRMKRRRSGWLVVAFFAVVAAIASCAAFACAQTAAENAQFGIEHGSDRRDGAAASTPKEEWRQGTIPHLYQTDAAWASAPYAGSDVFEAGCGPTCMSMVYAGLTGKTDRDPAAMAAFSEANGFVDSGMTSWSFMTEGAAMLGLSAEELPADANTLLSALREGRPVIASVRPGDFTTEGHFIVIAGIDEKGGLVVHDPNSPTRSAQAWDVQRILDQCANLWAYSAR